MTQPPPPSLHAPAQHGAPLAHRRDGRRLDRRHWLLAGVLGIVSGAIVLLSLSGPIVQWLVNPGGFGADILAFHVSQILLGSTGIVIAFALAPGGAARRAAGIAVTMLAVLGAFSVQWLLLTTPLPVGVRWLVSPQSLLVLGGVLGWLLASGARWWSIGVVLLVPAIAATAMGLVFAGVPSGAVQLAVAAVAGVVALAALLLSLPRRP